MVIEKVSPVENIQFLNNTHKKRFLELLSLDTFNNLERKPILYLIAGNESLYRERNCIYDFEGSYLKEYDDYNFSDGERLMLDLGAELYRGYGKYNIFKILSFMDKDCRSLCINALKLRFNIS